MSSIVGCPICETEQAGGERVVHRAAHWSVGPAEHRGVPGWLLVWTKVHTAGFDVVDRGALREFGEVLGDTTRALKEVVGTEKVYVVVFGDNQEHTHALLMARPPGLDPERNGASLLHDFQDLRAPELCRSIAATVGERLGPTR